MLSLFLALAIVPTIVSASSATAVPGVLISGTVTGPNGPLVGICVYLSDFDGGSFEDTVTTTGGTYSIDAGYFETAGQSKDVRLSFVDCTDGMSNNVVSEYYNDKPSYDTATRLTVTDGQPKTGVDATLAAAGRVAGKVTVPATSSLDDVCVDADDADYDSVGRTTPAADGTYSIGGLAPGTVKIQFYDCGGTGGNLVTQWYNNKPTFGSADLVTVVANQTASNKDASLALGGEIMGTVRNAADAVVQDVCVDAYTDPNIVAASDETAADGTYHLHGVPTTGTVKVRFQDCSASNDLLSEWNLDKPDFATANPVSVASSQPPTTVDAKLDAAAHITGTVTGPTNVGLKDVCVSLYDAATDTDSVAFDITGTTGVYDFGDLRAGDYKVDFSPCGATGVLGEWFDNQQSFSTATTVTLTTGQTRTVSPQLAAAAQISGTVTTSTNVGISGICVDAYSTADEFLDEAETGANGTYTLTGVRAGQVKINFYDCAGDALGKERVVEEWYNDKASFAAANTVSAVVGTPATGINAALATVGTPAPAPAPNPGPAPVPGPSAACTSATAALAASSSFATAAQAKVASANKKVKKLKKSGASATKVKAAKKKVTKAKGGLKAAQAAVVAAQGTKNTVC